MQVEMITVGPFQSNCFVVACEETGDAMLVDAGDDGDLILSTVERLNVDVKMIVNTHAHIDHVSALAVVAGALKVPVLMHKNEQPLYEMIPQQAAMFGLPAPALVKIDRYVTGGEELSIGKFVAEVVESPGHSPGGICLVFRGASPPCVFVGDVLFQGSIGRTDLFGANHRTMMATLKNVVMQLPDAMVVYPGHGPETTIGREKRSNPFLLELAGR
jgi:hydroxyacylglutathione hydrolase